TSRPSMSRRNEPSSRAVWASAPVAPRKTDRKRSNGVARGSRTGDGERGRMASPPQERGSLVDWLHRRWPGVRRTAWPPDASAAPAGIRACRTPGPPEPGTRRGGSHRECAGKRSEEHTSELQSRENLVCRLLLEKKNNI